MPPPIIKKKAAGKEHIPDTDIDLISYFRELGFEQILQPLGERPKMPNDLSQINGVELSWYQGAYGAWKEYTEDMLSVTNARIMILNEKYDMDYTMFKLSYQKGTPTEKKDKASVEPSIVAIRQELAQLNAYAGLLSAKVESYAGCLAVLSREISARTNNGR